MHQILFVGSESAVASLEADDNPANEFPCMSTSPFHKETRSQLYALVTGAFLDEAADMEILDQTFSYDGPYIYRLDAKLTDKLARQEEGQIDELASFWKQCESVENLSLRDTDLHEFLFQLIHFCQIAHNDDLSVYIYSDD